MTEIWKKLYVDTGIGSDYRRRTGVIQAMKDLLVPYQSYIVNPEVEHMIDRLELLFERCIMKLEEDIILEKERVHK